MPLTQQQRQSLAGLLVSLAVLALCVACVLWSTGCSKSPDASAATHPAFTFTALTQGKSMLPTFGEVELVQVELCRFSDLRTGDTVIYWNNEVQMFVHHRLIQRSEPDNLWLARGDNNAGRDVGRVTADEFIGRTHKI